MSKEFLTLENRLSSFYSKPERKKKRKKKQSSLRIVRQTEKKQRNFPKRKEPGNGIQRFSFFFRGEIGVPKDPRLLFEEP